MLGLLAHSQFRIPAQGLMSLTQFSSSLSGDLPTIGVPSESKFYPVIGEPHSTASVRPGRHACVFWEAFTERGG